MTGRLLDGAEFALRLLLGLIFVRAGLAKLQKRPHFISAVTNYRILNARSSELVGRSLPIVEVSLGGLLLLGMAQTWVATTLGVLLVLFAGAVGWNLVQGRVIDCGCHGPGAPKEITWGTVGRNMTLVAVAAILAARPSTVLSIMSGRRIGSSSISSGEGIAIGISVAALLLLERLVREAVRALGRLGDLAALHYPRAATR